MPKSAEMYLVLDKVKSGVTDIVSDRSIIEYNTKDKKLVCNHVGNNKPFLSVYSSAGLKLLQASGVVNTSELPTGVYLVILTNHEGQVLDRRKITVLKK